jgi:hypothetical protein
MMEIGNKVVFTGCSKTQEGFGGPYTGDINELTVGSMYTIKSIEEHTWHTHVSLEEVNGDFNSVCFDEIPTNNIPTFKEVDEVLSEATRKTLDHFKIGSCGNCCDTCLENCIGKFEE